MLVAGVSAQFGRGTLGEFANPNTTALALSVTGVCIPAAWANNLLPAVLHVHDLIKTRRIVGIIGVELFEGVLHG